MTALNEQDGLVDTIIVWHGSNGTEWRRKDGQSSAGMTDPREYVPASRISELEAENAKLRRALRMAAPHHQGGHSETGRAIAEALGISFPIRCVRDSTGNWLLLGGSDHVS